MAFLGSPEQTAITLSILKVSWALVAALAVTKKGRAGGFGERCVLGHDLYAGLRDQRVELDPGTRVARAPGERHAGLHEADR
jgi:hypothetical protein